ncbi:aromatic-ring-hydroxylating dioxygenase subunit beta [Zavarzinia compransoris]|uniref:Ring-hydroxylating dioxygenase subunit beta n=1 Tax=Zavarzinia compransoris TaxID=1264899 RepID=A0A317E6V0_9PROT|nr:aromatic-ring-hydroxylating dioxygenase subunit beta [Zavarzinia compransoris]PWR22000.1 ring-hydroxylating dioxygenase subunit beta [Zavarzinia compransoris]TDP47261.1 3-phenylpropionate/cinnamic acid dioxygenase small subunit [Zavarzinia compransoris]
MPVGTQDFALLQDVGQFIYREARLQDEHRYADWEALWADDGIYWVPANGDGGNPEMEMSILYDNRSRIGLRVRQLMTGRRYSQTPKSRLRRLISNIEILETAGDTVTAGCNAFIYESNIKGETLWAARNDYVLRREADGFRMVLKKVVLVNNAEPLYNLAFLV